MLYFAIFCLFRRSFLGKIIQKTTFLKLFSCYEKRLHSPFLPLHRQNKEVWVSGLNQHTANVPNRKVPKVRILLLPHIGSLAQLDQSTTLRTSVSGVRVSHESQYWRFGRVGLLHRSWKPAGGNVSKVRNRLKRVQKPSLLGLCRVHGDSQRNPSGVYMEFVAQLVECQVVALVVVGSIPIKLPNASIAQW